MVSKESPQVGHTGSAKRTVLTLAKGVLAYWVFDLYIMALPPSMWSVDYPILPVFSLAVGVFVGYRVRRHGWALAAVPPLVHFVPFLFTFRTALGLPWLAYRLPVGLLASMFGGFIGAHLERRE